MRSHLEDSRSQASILQVQTPLRSEDSRSKGCTITIAQSQLPFGIPYHQSRTTRSSQRINRATFVAYLGFAQYSLSRLQRPMRCWVKVYEKLSITLRAIREYRGIGFISNKKGIHQTLHAACIAESFLSKRVFTLFPTCSANERLCHQAL